MAEYASNGKGNLGVTLGAIGTGLSILGSMGNGVGLIGGSNIQNYATKDDLNNAILLAQKDSQIAMLKAQQASEVKMVDIYERVMQKVNSNKAEQDSINTQQAVYNSTATAATSVLQSQVAQLMGLTQLKIPNTSVCPGWGAVATNVVYTPTTSGTTAT